MAPARLQRPQFVMHSHNPSLKLSPHQSKNLDTVSPLLGDTPHPFLPEFRLSNSPDDLTLANVRWVEGDEALELMTSIALEQISGGHASQYVTKSVQRILDRYDFARAGGWVAFGRTLDGKEGEVPCFKPAKPRSQTQFVDFSGPSRISSEGFGTRQPVLNKEGNPKKIKYETPKGAVGLPLLPAIPWRYGYRIAMNAGIGEAYRNRFREAISDSEADPETHEQGKVVDQEFYQFIDHCVDEDLESQAKNSSMPIVPLFIVEGFKKALALVAEGKMALAIRGVSMWHKKGSRELHDLIAHFATEGRPIYICFDEDEKPSTIRNVRREALGLGCELERLGCIVRFLHWDGKRYGKGIDDVLFGHWPGRATWLTNTIDAALTVTQYRRYGLVAKAFDVLARWENLSYPIERETHGNYLPELPLIETHAIHVVSAGLGAGKTYRIGHDWVREAKAKEWLTIVISPMNSLGQQTAERWGIPHIHNFDPRDSELLWSQAIHEGGVVLCADSLHRLPCDFFETPVLLVLDEANQVAQSLTNAGTLGDRQSDILKIVTELAEHAAHDGALVLAEDGIADRAVRFMQSLSRSQHIRVFRHHRQQQSWDCHLYSGQVSGFRAKTLAAVKAGEKLLFVTSSQREARRLERVIETSGIAAQVTRIDSQTNEQGQFAHFFHNPDEWLKAHQPDVLILSPSAKSGISIEAPYFDAVYGYFPALAGDTHWQLLGRYRQPVPRHIYTPPFIHAAADELLMSPKRVKQRYATYATQMAQAFGIEGLLTLPADGDVEQIKRIQEALENYHAIQQTVQGAQKVIAYEYLKTRLEKAGHRITEIKCGFVAEISELWKSVQDAIWWDEADQIAQLSTQDSRGNELTPEWAYRTLRSLHSTHVERIRANKVLWRHEFPGVLFDDAPTCYEALCVDYGAMRRGVLLQAAAQNLKVTKAIEREKAEKILKADIKALHRLPRSLARANIIAQCGILELLDGQEYSRQSPIALQIKQRALANSEAIRHYLELHIKPEQGPVAICNKLLRKIGLEIDKPGRAGAVKRVQRKGGEGNQHWIYCIDLTYSPTRIHLLEAAQQKLAREDSHDFDSSQSLIKEIVTMSQEEVQPSNKRMMQEGATALSIPPSEEVRVGKLYEAKPLLLAETESVAWERLTS